VKKVLLFGATGSIGKQTLDIISRFRDRFTLLGISGKSRLDNLLEISERFRPPLIALPDEESVSYLAERLSYKPEFFVGDEGLARMASEPSADVAVVAISGIKGLIPAYYALKTGKRVALANKESIIGGGFLLLSCSQSSGGEIIPVDSEHSALFQLLQKYGESSLRKVYLTASGGPFIDWALEDLEKVTPELALKHPTWKMGEKITIDSATLMNKGFEVIEAAVLFNLSPERIEVLIHPQSTIHALVELVDGTIFAHLSKPDMRLPIAYALFYPERPTLDVADLSFNPSLTLNLFPPDFQRFPCLALAYSALKLGHPYPLILEASDEVAVPAFLEGRIKFTDIPRVLEKTLNEFTIRYKPSTVDEILAFHEEVKNFTEEMIKSL
jgi:1-deoxy-D-xylulose-5-phosphate reductoisomerase